MSRELLTSLHGSLMANIGFEAHLTAGSIVTTIGDSLEEARMGCHPIRVYEEDCNR